jgi:rubrerythrin
MVAGEDEAQISRRRKYSKGVWMMEGLGTSRTAPDDYVEFWTTGQSVKGEFHCAECGYGVTIVRALPICPMCGGRSWEQSSWSPFGRASALL